MFRRFSRHLNPPTVIATIALFAGVGGGYAIGFSGSGSLKTGANTITGDSQFHVIRSLPGIGTVEGRCTPADDVLLVRIHNNSGTALVAKTQRLLANSYSSNFSFANGTDDDHTVPTGFSEDFRIDIYPAAATAKRPQAQLTIHAENSGPNCSTARMTVLALSTEE